MTFAPSEYCACVYVCYECVHVYVFMCMRMLDFECVCICVVDVCIVYIS